VRDLRTASEDVIRPGLHGRDRSATGWCRWCRWCSGGRLSTAARSAVRQADGAGDAGAAEAAVAAGVRRRGYRAGWCCRPGPLHPPSPRTTKSAPLGAPRIPPTCRRRWRQGSARRQRPTGGSERETGQPMADGLAWDWSDRASHGGAGGSRKGEAILVPGRASLIHPGGERICGGRLGVSLFSPTSSHQP
jgi:hypothetical protein